MANKHNPPAPARLAQAEARADAGGIPVFCAHDKLVDPRELIGNPRNPNKHPKSQIKLLAKVIQAQGWRAPITVSTRSGFIVRGHGRLEAALEFGAALVPVDCQEYATEAEEWADLIADNRLAELAELAETDEGQLALLLAELERASADIDVELSGYSTEHITEIIGKQTDNAEDAFMAAALTLRQKYLVPPFSVLDARAGAWIERKRAWRGLGIKSELGRGEDGDAAKTGLTFGIGSQPKEAYKAKNAYETKTGNKVTWREFAELLPQEMALMETSIFDPVLCEVAYRWFYPQGGGIIDPFAGGSARGMVAALTGRNYTGVDLSRRQIEANAKNWGEISLAPSIGGDPENTTVEPPRWIGGDSMEIKSLH
jgi:hypothetical protein